LARIQLLENELAEREAGLKKAMEDMKYFKLELLNREQNYNKVFGRQPTVGVMDVLKTAIPKPPGAASTSAMADEVIDQILMLGQCV